MVKATHLEVFGNEIKVYYEDNTSSLAYPTMGSIWLVSGETGGGGGDDYSWPYPLDYVTSEFGPRGTGFHEGMDWSGGPALTGQPIPAIGAGSVQYAGGPNGTGFGNHVILHHGTFDGYDWKSLYAHMNTLPVVSTGATVIKGQTLGPVGNSGNSFGAHLHMETHRCAIGGGIVWMNGNPSWSAERTAINPRNFMSTYGDGAVLIP